MLRLKGCEMWGQRGLAWREPAGPSGPGASRRRSWAPALQGEWDTAMGLVPKRRRPVLWAPAKQEPHKGF